MVRRVLVTGANKGIGLAIVRRCLLDHEDVHVVLGCRSVQRADEAIQELLKEAQSWQERVSVLELDTSSNDSITQASARLADKLNGEKIYAICNNAGIVSSDLREIFAVNVYGPKLVTDAFLPLVDAQSGRVVNISSGAASGFCEKCSEEQRLLFVNPDVTWKMIEDKMNECLAFPNGVKDFAANGLGANMGGYGLTKALLNSYTVMLARENPVLKVNACTPGLIVTDIGAGMLPSGMQWILPQFAQTWISSLAMKAMGGKTPDEGTVAPMYLLFSELEGNGRYYGSDAKRSPLDRYRSPGSPPYEEPSTGARV